MKSKKLNLFLRCLCSLGAGLFVVLVPFGSSAVSAQVAGSSSTSVPMTLVGVSNSVQLANGMSELTLSNGQEVTVPAAVASRVQISTPSNGVQPDTTVTGDCGTADIYIYANANDSGITGVTAWDVNYQSVGTVYYFQWGVDTTNVTYNRSAQVDWDEDYAQLSWLGSFDDIQGTGHYHSEVIQSDGSPGYVFGTTGVCEAASPAVLYSNTDV